MGDLISRQAAIDVLHGYFDGMLETDTVCPKDIYNLFAIIPSVQPEQHWIPCSERLPEECGEYRITWTTSASKNLFIGDSEYEITSEWDDERNDWVGKWLLDDYITAYPDVKVIAWKPLEEPYKEEGGE